MNERIRKVREKSGLNQDEFGKRIGIGKTSVSKLETGENRPAERTLLLICKEFNVNETWLRTGEGTMSSPLHINDLVARSAQLLGEKDPVFEAFVEAYSRLDPSDRKVLLNFGMELFKTVNEKLGD